MPTTHWEPSLSPVWTDAWSDCTARSFATQCDNRCIPGAAEALPTSTSAPSMRAGRSSLARRRATRLLPSSRLRSHTTVATVGAATRSAPRPTTTGETRRTAARFGLTATAARACSDPAIGSPRRPGQCGAVGGLVRRQPTGWPRHPRPRRYRGVVIQLGRGVLSPTRVSVCCPLDPGTRRAAVAGRRCG